MALSSSWVSRVDVGRLGLRRSLTPWRRALSTAVCAASLLGCSERVHLLGYDEEVPTPVQTQELDGGSRSTTSTESSATSSTTVVADSDNDGGESASGESREPDAGLDAGVPIPEPTNPPNLLVDVLELDPDVVTARLTELYDRLFDSGATDSERIYFEREPDGAYVFDVLHDDTRMDAMGYGMMLSLQFDRPDKFARLWNTVKNQFRYATGPRRGFFRFSCATDFSQCADAIDSFGAYYAVTALFLASERWNRPAYRSEALEVLSALRDKEVDGNATDGVLNLFTSEGVPRRIPLEEQAGTVSPVALLPAFYEFWFVQTGDEFWHTAAQVSRRLLLTIPHPTTGLSADLVTESGEPADMPPLFREESYPAMFQLALDAAWFSSAGPPPADYVDRVNRLLGFFQEQGPTTYVALYEVDGTLVEDRSSLALISLNGASAAIATLPSRNAYMERVWDSPPTAGRYRFYDGVYHLLSLAFLAGQLRVVF